MPPELRFRGLFFIGHFSGIPVRRPGPLYVYRGAMETRGPNPSQFSDQQVQSLLRILNETAVQLNREIVRAMPVGVGGDLQRSWTLVLATEQAPQASVGTSSKYFMAVEMGRKPGSGISAAGQEAVALWARRKLQLGQKQSQSFAYLLSEKYKKQGRPAQGLIGLAAPGSQGSPVPTDPSELVPGSILANAYQSFQNKLNQL